MLLRLAPLLLAPLLAQEPSGTTAMDATVLRQQDHEYRAREVLARLARWDASLLPTLQADPEYLRLYLASPVFAEQVRAFSDSLLLDAERLPEPDAKLLEREARAWADDRGLPADPAAALAIAGIEIETRARLLAQQPESFSTNELRQHATLFDRAESEYFLQNIPPMFITVFHKMNRRNGHRRPLRQPAELSTNHSA